MVAGAGKKQLSDAKGGVKNGFLSTGEKGRRFLIRSRPSDGVSRFYLNRRVLGAWPDSVFCA